MSCILVGVSASMHATPSLTAGHHASVREYLWTTKMASPGLELERKTAMLRQNPLGRLAPSEA